MFAGHLGHVKVERYYLRTHQGLFLTLFRLLDISLLGGAGVLSYRVVAESWPPPIAVALVVIAALIFHIASAGANLYKPWRGMKLRYEMGLVMLVTLVSCAIVFGLAALPYMSSSAAPLLSWVTLWSLSTATLLCALRLMIRPALRRIRQRGFNQRTIAFVAVCDHTLDFARELRSHPEFGYRIIGYVDDRTTPRTNEPVGMPRLGGIDDLEQICREHDVDQVWIDFPLDAQARVKTVVDALADWPITIRHLMQMNSVSPLCGSVTGILGTPVLDIDLTATDGYLTNLIKTVSDRVIAAVVLLVTAPLLLAIALAIKITSPGPVIYRQKRVTWRNTPFEMLKFRTMPVGIENETGPRWAQPDEDRATPLGAFLRRTSLDELPQFWNVLRGDMSIVGPRPERPEFVAEFRKEIPNYMKKHRVKAGITGWAQVHGLRGATDLNERIDYDLYYIRNSSFSLDMKIIGLTLIKGFNDRNAY